MKIIVVTRTLNEAHHIEKFTNGYNFADKIIVSDGGSTDGTIEKLKRFSKVIVYDSPYKLHKNEYLYNPDNPNINFVIDKGLELEPDFLILDDFDCWPNRYLNENARGIIENCRSEQINAFRLYMWGNTGMFYPKMNNYFDINYTSFWGFYPKRIMIGADESLEHGTITGLSKTPYNIEIPNCLLHYSWYPETIDEKVKRYNQIGLPMIDPREWAGEQRTLPDFAYE